MNDVKIQIIKSVIYNYPLLKALGYVLPLPVAILCSSPEEKLWWKKELALFEPKEIRASMRLKEVRSLLESVNSEPVFWVYRRHSEVFRLLKDYVENHKEARNGVPIVFFERYIPDEVRGEVILIDAEISELPEKRIGEIPEECPDAELIPALFQEMRQFVPLNQEGAIFTAAVYLLKPLAYKKGCSLDIWFVAAEKIIEGDQPLGIQGDIKDYFVSCLYLWQKTEGFKKVTLASSEIPLEREEREKWILYSEEDVFVPESIFREIIESSKATYSTTYMKQELYKAGVLQTDSARGFTVKLLHSTIDGNKYRSRYLKFDRKKIRKKDEFDFIVLCQMEGEAK